MTREQTYMTKIENQLNINNTQMNEPHSVNELNFMFFVVKDWKNQHQSLEDV